MTEKSSKRSSQGTKTGIELLSDFLDKLLNRRVTDRSKIQGAAERYLDSRHYTLYANWDISHPDRKAEAVQWLTNQVLNVLDEMGG